MEKLEEKGKSVFATFPVRKFKRKIIIFQKPTPQAKFY